MLRIRSRCRTYWLNRSTRFSTVTSRRSAHTTAFVFTGQGSQYSGMASDLARQFKPARMILEQCDEALKMNLSKLMFNGTQLELRMTDVAQPAIIAHELAVMETEVGWAPGTNASLVLGHSVGEIAALASAKAFSIEDAIRFARHRGQSMQNCVKGAVSMLALLPIDEESANKAVQEAEKITGEIVDVANINSPKQIVISGTELAVSEAGRIAKEKYGARRLIELDVSAPFHSRIMRPAEKPIREFLEQKTTMKTPVVSLVSNYNAEAVQDVETIKELLVRQTSAPVQWVKCINYCIQHNIKNFIEVGPRQVLSQLIRKISPDVNTIFIGSAPELVAFLKNPPSFGNKPSEDIKARTYKFNIDTTADAAPPMH